MRPIMHTPEEQAAMLADIPGLRHRPTAAKPAPPRKCRTHCPETRRKRVEQSRLYSARMRLKESLGMLHAAHASGDAGAIRNADQWATQRRDGLRRVLRELGIDPETEELLHGR
jgi:hypothetical protein